MRLILFLVVLATGVLSCGKKSEGPISRIQISGGTLSPYLDSLELDRETPEGVGTLLSLEPGSDKVSLCTWSMIDESLALTNSHCIPKTLKDSAELPCGKYLSGRIKTPGGTQLVSCKKIVSASLLERGSIRDQDYSLIEVNESVSTNLGKISRDGIADGERIKLYSMNHYQYGHVYSAFVEHDCLVRSSATLLQWRSRASSPLVGFKEQGSSASCRTIPGNSGSPVLNARGDIIGVIQAGFKEGASFTPPDGIRNHLLTSHVSIFTNLRCLRLGIEDLDTDLPADCADGKISSVPDTEGFQKMVEEKNIAAVEHIVDQQPPVLGFEVKLISTGNPNTNWIYPEPYCAFDLPLWPESLLSEVESVGFLKKEKRLKLRLRNYLLRTIIDVDYYGNFQLEVSPQETSSTRELRLERLQELTEKKQIILIDVDAQTQKPLPVCEL